MDNITNIDEIIICSCCGKEISPNADERKAGTTSPSVGASIKLMCEPYFTSEYMSRQLGKYKLDATYSVCWECFLSAFKINPEIHQAIDIKNDLVFGEES